MSDLSNTIRINGRPVSVEWTNSAARELSQRAQPLVVELELYFSCLVKKVRLLPRNGTAMRHHPSQRQTSCLLPPRYLHRLLVRSRRPPGPAARDRTRYAQRAQDRTEAGQSRLRARGVEGAVLVIDNSDGAADLRPKQPFWCSLQVGRLHPKADIRS